MGTSFSTDDVQHSERYDYWLHMHREALAIDLRFPNGRHDWFRARCAVTELGAMSAVVLFYAGGPAPSMGEAHRTPTFCGQMDAYEIKFSLACEQFVLTQDGRQDDLHPGDFAIADLTRPSSAMAAGRLPKHVASFIVPRTLLPLPSPQVARLTAVRMSGQHGPAALVSTLLRRITTDAGTYPPAQATRICTALLDLVAATLAGRLDLSAALPPEVERSALLHRIYAYMHRHLADPGLTPRKIVNAHHISLRQLHKLFEDEEHTVAEWIRSQRLDRCRRDLTDPALSGRPVAAISARWGFGDPGHFSRLFRTTYGMPPGEYRRLRTPHADPDASSPRRAPA
ncbi:helix-turn-helix domain-containing protein [Actinomadura sp. 6N118]|uniref:helix-turn-helix domain-containing protein n=1 Tax=Actinomadura sp. 6N118 TaxID=3375151 RepID=UPI0037B846E5